MNSHIAVGVYSMSDASSKTIKNVAFTGASVIEVICTDVYIIQRQSGVYMESVKTRFRNNYGEWTSWR